MVFSQFKLPHGEPPYFQRQCARVTGCCIGCLLRLIYRLGTRRKAQKAGRTVSGVSWYNFQLGVAIFAR